MMTNIGNSEFIKKMNESSTIFQNFSVVYNKAKNDGYINKIYECLNFICKEELNYTQTGNLKRTSQVKIQKWANKSEGIDRSESLCFQGKLETYFKFFKFDKK